MKNNIFYFNRFKEAIEEQDMVNKKKTLEKVFKIRGRMNNGRKSPWVKEINIDGKWERLYTGRKNKIECFGDQIFMLLEKEGVVIKIRENVYQKRISLQNEPIITKDNFFTLLSAILPILVPTPWR